MQQPDRVERLTNLVLVLLDSTEPLSLSQIAEVVAGYPEAPVARRRAFERDKQILREEGVPIATEMLEDQPGVTGYRIRAQDYYLPELGLAPEEQLALNLAVAGVHLADPTGRGPMGQGALLKLGGMERDGPGALAALPALPALPVLHEAVAARATVDISYRGTRRTVHPYGLRFARGHWYLVAYDRGRAAERTFRVDRIEGEPLVGSPGSFEAPVPESFPGGARQGPWTFGESGSVEALVEIDALAATEVVAELGEASVRERRAGGSVVVALEVANVPAFRSWVLGLLDHAVVLSPPELRDGIVGWLAGAGAG